MDARASPLDSTLRRSPSVALEHHDPVCGMTVSESSAHRADWDSKPYWFCSAGCRSRFLGNPRHYLAMGAPDGAPAAMPQGAARAAPAPQSHRLGWGLALGAVLLLALAGSFWL